MKTHEQALYIRKDGDKFRPLVIRRPTLRQIEAKLRVNSRRIKSVESKLKDGEQAPPFLIVWRRYRAALKAYLAGIGKEAQDDNIKAALRLGHSVRSNTLAAA